MPFHVLAFEALAALKFMNLASFVMCNMGQRCECIFDLSDCISILNFLLLLCISIGELFCKINNFSSEHVCFFILSSVDLQYNFAGALTDRNKACFSY